MEIARACTQMYEVAPKSSVDFKDSDQSDEIYKMSMLDSTASFENCFKESVRGIW